jgi:hypothetical protein
MNWFAFALVIITLVCVCLPCRYDPVKDWLDGMDKEPSDDC